MVEGSVVKRGQARNELIKTAARLIGERGLHGFPIRDVADATHVSPGSVVYHFSTRDALLSAVIDEHYEKFAAIAKDAVATTLAEAALSALVQLYGDRARALLTIEISVRAATDRSLRTVGKRMSAATTALLRLANSSQTESYGPLEADALTGEVLRLSAKYTDDVKFRRAIERYLVGG